MRDIQHRYRDPVDLVWIHCAGQIGMDVRRSRADFASWDGASTLHIGEPDLLDEDDCLAQMIFHELCHSLVEGVESFSRSDWGLDNTSSVDEIKEHACLRTQAHLAGGHGLREVLAPTTDFRSFYDSLPVDPLDPRGSEESRLAVLAIRRSKRGPWAPHLARALEKTAAIATLVNDATPPTRPDERASIWDRFTTPPQRHPGGLPVLESASTDACCGTCSWRHVAGPGKKVDRCRQLDGARVDRDWPACLLFESGLDCQTCGACCRDAYQSVTISRRDPVVEKAPELIVDRGTYLELARVEDHCAALEAEGDPSRGQRYCCTIYDDRPRPCREFERGGRHCLTARRVLGYSL